MTSIPACINPQVIPPAPQKKSTAEGATFPGYYEELKKYTSLQSIKDLAFNDPVSYDDYDFASVKG